MDIHRDQQSRYIGRVVDESALRTCRDTRASRLEILDGHPSGDPSEAWRCRHLGRQAGRKLCGVAHRNRMNGTDVVGHQATLAETELAATWLESLDSRTYRGEIRSLETNCSAEEPPANGVVFETTPDFKSRARHERSRFDGGLQLAYLSADESGTARSS